MNVASGLNGKICRYCGKDVPLVAKYCNYCGQLLITKEEKARLEDQKKQDEIRKAGEEYLETLSGLGKKLGTDGDLMKRFVEVYNLSAKMYQRLEEEPEDYHIIKKYENIYLPKLKNAIDVYAGIRDGGMDEAEISRARNNLEQAFDIGSASMVQLMKRTYQGDQMDLETDVSVLKQMFGE